MEEKRSKPPHPRPSAKLRGHPKDSEDVRLSKTLSYILRHGAKSEGLVMRDDGYARVADLLALPKMRSLSFSALRSIVNADAKQRYHLLFESSSDAEGTSSNPDGWWIRANQGHTLKDVKLVLREITDASQVPMVVHGTSLASWKAIERQGLSRMKRNHIHLAQGVPGDGVISGMRQSSQVLIYVDLPKALNAGLKFHISDNGVVLTEGDDNGYLLPEYFRRVERANGQALPGWEGVADVAVLSSELETLEISEDPSMEEPAAR